MESPFKPHIAKNPSDSVDFTVIATLAVAAFALGLFNAYYNYKNAQTSQSNNELLLRLHNSLQGGQ